MTAPAPLAIVAGRYQIVSTLGTPGKDAQGESYKALDLHTQETVAIKILGATPLGTWHEARSLTQLRDDHILPIRNADLAAGRPYLVTQLAEHGTLAARIDAAGNIGIEPTQAVRWVRQACQATSRAHADRLIHTDIKPDNLFLDEHNNVQLGDFGYASLMDGNDLGHTSGTVTTLAPEVATAIVNTQARASSPRSDVYSLGATLYELLTGQSAYSPPPGYGMDLEQNAPRIAAHRPTPLRDLAPHVSRPLADRIAKAMSVDPDDRYRTAGEFASALGYLPRPVRYWRRTDEHAGHHRCWRGIPDRGAEVTVCVESNGSRFTISAAKQPSGRRIRDATVNLTVATARLPAAVRKAIAQLS